MSNPPSRSPPQLIVKRQLLFCVEKLLNVISRRQRDLRNKCIDVQKEIKSLSADPPNGNGDKYWLIFQMSCESQVPPIVEVALDSIQKLMAASILTGQTRDKNGKPLIDVIVRTICNCCAIESEKVQLQIVKAILTLGTSPSSQVHGQSLLMCLRACYNIFLSTKNIDVQTSAKAVLTQIVCAVFQKMEKAHQLSLKKQAARDEKAETRLMCRSIIVTLSNHIAVNRKYDAIVAHEDEKSEAEQKDKDIIHNAEEQINEQEDNKVNKERNEQKEILKEAKEKIKPTPQKQPKTRKDSNNKSTQSGKFGWCVLCASAANHYCIQTRDPVCSLDCKMSNLQHTIHFLRTYADLNTFHNDTISRLELAYKSTILTNDGHILFRALCRQAHKTLPTDAMQQKAESQHSWLDFKIPRLFDPHSAMKPLALKSKVLSLELLRLVFSNTGHTFKSSHRFIDAVRECFVPVVTENAVSTVENIFALAVNMFSLLVEGYRKYLKNEIGVLLDNVFLQIAESPHSNFKQKKMALTVFNKICREPQVLIGIFLNYDCGHEHNNIFQRIIDLLEKICSAKQVVEQTSWSPQLVENVELRRLAIEILVNIIRYANEWVVKANKANAQIYEEKFKTKNMISSVSEQASEETSDGNHNEHDTEENNVNASASQHLQRYAEKKKIQQNILNAVLKFNLKPKEGIKYLMEHQLIEDSVESVVEFLKNTPSLNKTQIGDYLGGAKPYNISIMHAFIDSIDFADLALDDGIRKLCTHFKLPGEAAQIDRIMQKFAEKYCLQNFDIFKEADDAYILSYAIIMLNVALHHPQIKKRMTKEEFSKNNLLAVTDQTLEPLMYSIYDRISEREILLDDKHASENNGKHAHRPQETAFAGFAWMNGLYNNQYNQQSGSSYLEQRKNIIEKVNTKVQQVSLKRNRRRDATFYEPHSEDVEALQPMFSICWLASLATFSVLLEDPSAEILLQYYQQSYYGSHNKSQSKNDSNKYSADQLIGLCLNGYRYGIKFASNLGMDVEAESYVNSLASLTLLGTEKTMQQKNIEAIKTLLKIADEEGNILRKSWVQILKCVSELDVLHLIKSKAVSDSSHFLQEKEAKQIYGAEGLQNNNLNDYDDNNNNNKNGANKKNKKAKNKNNNNAPNKYQLKLARKQARLNSDGVIRYGHSGDDNVSQQNVNSVTTQINQSMIDKIYQDSVKLDSEGIVHFSVGLSCVSAMELDNRLNPRVFSLRKIVEVAHDNINLRIPLVWQRIWNVLSPHFVKAGCHNNTNVGAYAINSLRQLALLFFEKEELANFQFQNKFLIPFQHIMERTKSQEIRLLIVECIFRIVKARFGNVKSGWKTVFSVLGIAAKDPHEELSSATFKITQQILKDYFPLLKYDNNDSKEEEEEIIARQAPQVLAAETLDECVNCLVSFSGNIWTDISLKAINNLVLCAQHLYDLDHGMRSSAGNAGNKEFHPQKESPMIKAWFLCLTGLSRLIFDDRIEVRCKSLEALFQILQQHGEGFSTSMWELIFRGVLLPIFDDIYHNQIQQRSSIMSPSNQQIMHQLDTDWLESTGITALAQLIALFTLFFTNCRFMMDKIALLLQSGINQLNEKTAKISVKCWKILIDGTAHLLTDTEWNIIIHSLSKSLSASLPFAFSALFDSKCCEYQSYQREQRDRERARDHNKQSKIAATHHRYPMPKYNKSVTSVQCMVHLIILDQLFNISVNHSNKLNTKHMNMLLNAFEHSYKFARDFNQNGNFRNFLWNAAHISPATAAETKNHKHFIAADDDSPDLYFQESRSSSIILETLLRLCSNYIPSNVAGSNNTDKTPNLKLHKFAFMTKLYIFCNHLVESYCADAKVEPFSLSTSPSINIQNESVYEYNAGHEATPPYHALPTEPAPSIPKIPSPQKAKIDKRFPNAAKNRNKSSARAYSSARAASNINRNRARRKAKNTEKGLRWKTGVIVMLLDSILNDSLWKNHGEQQQFVLNLYDYLILCIAIDNREIRQRISKLFGETIKNMLVKQYPQLIKIDTKQNVTDNNSNNNNNDNQFQLDINRIVSL